MFTVDMICSAQVMTWNDGLELDRAVLVCYLDTSEGSVIYVGLIAHI